MANAQTAEIARTVETIRPLLGGLGPTVQGGVLADLVAIWLAGHDPRMRQVAFDLLIETVQGLIPINEKIIFGPGGFPKGDVDG